MFYFFFLPYKLAVLLVKHRQTVQTQIRHGSVQRLSVIRLSTAWKNLSAIYSNENEIEK